MYKLPDWLFCASKLWHRKRSVQSNGGSIYHLIIPPGSLVDVSIYAFQLPGTGHHGTNPLRHRKA